MGVDIAAMVITVAVVAGTVWFSSRYWSRIGLMRPGDLPPGKRRNFWLIVVGSSLPALIGGIAIADGHPALGIAVLIAAFVLPEFVLMPIRIRRSRRVADEARARRTGTKAS
jgi:hypothetical protein